MYFEGVYTVYIGVYMDVFTPCILTVYIRSIAKLHGVKKKSAVSLHSVSTKFGKYTHLHRRDTVYTHDVE